MFSLESIKINNFRCYSNKIYTFSQGINILYGNNAVGKTTVLEGIGYLAYCKSFRGAKDLDLLRKGEEFFFLRAKFHVSDEKKDEITISYQERNKKINKNNNVVKKINEYIGYFNVISFEPADLDLIKGAPSIRRRFLDLNISQISSKYLDSLIKYNKLLKKRNDYLKNEEVLKHKKEEYLDVIDELIIIEGKYIIETREKFIEIINKYINEASLEISSHKESVKIIYKPSESLNLYENSFKSKKKYDFISKTTNIGPHRDDFIVKINNNDASIYASQGQNRTAVIAIKLGLAKYFKEINEKQIILLDDVFSELDFDRQNKLLEILNNDTQIFITTTNVENINKEILDKSKLIKVEKETLV